MKQRLDFFLSVVVSDDTVNQLKNNLAAMDPLAWLARMADHIPDPGKHGALFYGQPGQTAAQVIRQGCREPEEARVLP
jgi:hypothetical protein